MNICVENNIITDEYFLNNYQLNDNLIDSDEESD